MTNVVSRELDMPDAAIVHLFTDVSRALKYCDRFGMILQNVFEQPINVKFVIYPDDASAGAIANLKARLRTACARYHVTVKDVILGDPNKVSSLIAPWFNMPRDRLASGHYSIWNDVTHDSYRSRETNAEYVIFEVFPL